MKKNKIKDKMKLPEVAPVSPGGSSPRPPAAPVRAGPPAAQK